ncbi:MAG: hypothetical protein FGM33_09230 [Candidatus Kapabacteria bacterium]|nr:hypothetical protein [Candidatus Kapabacteria bacterium]
MRITAAILSIWYGLVDPKRVKQVSTDAAAAVFAVAVLAIALTATVCSLWEQGHPGLVADSALLSQQTLQASPGSAELDLSTPQRQFTGALGGTLIVTIVSVAALAGLFMIMARFLTNTTPTYSRAIIAVSSAALIAIIDTAVASVLHVTFGTAQYGLHAGVFIRPSDSPMLFTWLQLISLGSIWRFLAIAVALVTWENLHWRYGIVVGLVVWTISRLAFGIMALVGWVVGLQGAGQLAP